MTQMDEFITRLQLELKSHQDVYRKIVMDFSTFINTYSSDEWPDKEDIVDTFIELLRQNLTPTPDTWLLHLQGQDPSMYVDGYRAAVGTDPAFLSEDDICPNPQCRAFKDYHWHDTEEYECVRCGTKWPAT